MQYLAFEPLGEFLRKIPCINLHSSAPLINNTIRPQIAWFETWLAQIDCLLNKKMLIQDQNLKLTVMTVGQIASTVGHKIK
jgi:hypothetical protein